MQTIAVLPVKTFNDAKHRLQDELPHGSRRALAEAMFSDVLVALRRAEAVDQVIVVSGDPAAQLLAGGHGATALADDETGHNAAAAAGVQEALRMGAARALLVPGDCPLLDPDEVDELIGRPASGPSAVIVPDRHHTGTNALLLTPPDVLEPAFGVGSCERHLRMARANGTPAEVVEVDSLALDIDTPEDIAALQSVLQITRGAAAHTRGMLTQLTRSQA